MMIFTEMYLSFVFIKFHALVPVASTARNVGITNIRVVLSANILFNLVLSLSYSLYKWPSVIT